MIGKRVVFGLSAGWKFFRSDAEGASAKRFDDSGWKAVTVPHDWSVGEPFSESYSSGTGYVAGGIGWYRKSFNITDVYAGKKIFITFDGVYNNSQVWCNGNNLGRRPYGYSSFTFDITPFCSFGARTNVVSVKVCHTDLADSRWFTGSGIFRDVRITVANPVHIDEYSPFVTTVSSSADAATIAIETTLVNGGAAACNATLRHSLVDPFGRAAGTAESPVRLAPGEKKAARSEIGILKPLLWSPDSPALYTVVSEVSVAGRALDRVETPTGIRTFSFDSARGFFLNGVGMKIKGVCVHHDAGCLGAAVPQSVWRHRLRLLKDMGCNAIRMSHNPPDPKLLDLCDSMGFLVMDEAFDEWEGVKNKWSTGHNVYPPKHFGYGDDFPVWHETDLRSMVMRDRNHPSIILWSVGNEVDYPNDPYCHPSFLTMVGNNDANKPAQEMEYDPDKPNAERLASIAGRLVSIVKACDPSRPVTAAIAFPELSNATGYSAALDVVGYNYKEHLYAQDHADYPGRVLYGSENSAGYEQWLAVRDTDYICAQFIWTGIDYLGEAKGWPVRASPAGFIDLAGNPKPKYYFRKSLWSREPFLFLSVRRKGGGGNTGGQSSPQPDAPHWNWREGELLEIVCYTNRDSAELFLNGDSLGSRSLAESTVGYLCWETAFAPGVLAAVSGASGATVFRSELRTSGPAASIAHIVPERGAFEDLGSEGVARLEFGIIDAEGIPVHAAANAISVAVEGSGELIGLENGDIADTESYAASSRNAFNGKLVAYVRVNADAGTEPVIVTASSPGLVSARVSIPGQKAQR
jgi:hypothetical protein